MKLPNPLETVAHSSPKVKLALGAAGLFLFIVGVKRSLPKRDEDDRTTQEEAQEIARPDFGRE
jgi:hypothetical protein